MTPEQIRRNLNFRMFTFEGIFFIFASSFLDPNSIIPSFISQLTDSSVLIGLATTIRNCGWLMPQLFVAGYAHSLIYKKPLLLFSAGIMRFSAGFLALTAVLSLKLDPYRAVILFYLFFTIYSFADGISGIPWLDVIAKGIDPQKKGYLFGRNHFIGGSMAFLGGFVIRSILNNVAFPYNFAFVFFIGFVFLVISYTFLFGVDEPPSKITRGEKTSFTNYIQSLPVVFKKPVFSILMLTNISLRFLFMALPFYVVFGEKVLLFSKEMVGYFVSAQTLGYVVSSRLWGYLSDNLSNRSVITGTCISAIAAPLCALSVYGMKLMDLNFLLIPMYLLLFLTIGFTMSGLWIGFNNLILEISDDQTRPTYIGLYNTLSAPMTFSPILGGKIIEMFSYIHLFVITAFFLMLALITSRYIREPQRIQNELQ